MLSTLHEFFQINFIITSGKTGTTIICKDAIMFKKKVQEVRRCPGDLLPSSLEIPFSHIYTAFCPQVLS